MSSQRTAIVHYLILVCAAACFPAHEITLKNGTVIQGEIVSENNNFYVVDREGSSLKILKSLIDKIDGKAIRSDCEEAAEPGKSGTPSPSGQKAESPDSISLQVKKGKTVALKLKNGTVFNGVITSENVNFINFDIGGTEIRILKSLVAFIGKPSDISAADSLKPPREPAGTKITQTKPAQKKELPKTPPQKKSASEKNGSAAGRKTEQTGSKITLKNGTLLSGKIVVENVNFISVNIEGSVLKILKTMIADIDGKALETAPERMPVAQQPSAQEPEATKEKSVSVVPAQIKFDENKATPSKPTAIRQTPQTPAATPSVPPIKTTPPLQEKTTSAVAVKSASAVPVPEPLWATGTDRSKSGFIYPGNDKKVETGTYPSQKSASRDTVMRIASVSDVVLRSTIAPNPIRDESETETSIQTPAKKSTTKISEGRIEQLISRLDSPDPAERIKAASELGEFGNKAVEPLVNLLKDKNPAVRRNAVRALSLIKDDYVTTVLIKSLKDKDLEVQSLANSELTERAPVDKLIVELNSRDSDIRKNSVEILGILREKHAVDYILIALKDRNSSVREKAAYALGMIMDPKSGDALIASMKDGISFVRANAAFALGELREPKAVEPLLDALRDESPIVRENAAVSLGKLRDTRAIEPLSKAARDPNPDVKKAAKEALRHHTDVAMLIEALNEKSQFVKDNAEYSLFLMTGKNFGKDHKKWKEWFAKKQGREQ